MEIEFARLRQGILCDTFQFFQVYMVVVNEENDIVEVSIEAAIQFAERDAVRIGNVNIQAPELTDADTALVASFWQRNKALNRDRLNMDFQFPGNLYDGSMQFVRMHIIADEVNIYGWARTSKQSQCASAYQK